MSANKKTPSNTPPAHDSMDPPTTPQKQVAPTPTKAPGAPRRKRATSTRTRHEQDYSRIERLHNIAVELYTQHE